MLEEVLEGGSRNLARNFWWSEGFKAGVGSGSDLGFLEGVVFGERFRERRLEGE